jgi:hypothetical protein
MNPIAKKSWSATMNVALRCLVALGAVVFLLSIFSAGVAWKDEGHLTFSLVARMVGSGVWTLFFVALRKHPEWLREKF